MRTTAQALAAGLGTVAVALSATASAAAAPLERADGGSARLADRVQVGSVIARMQTLEGIALTAGGNRAAGERGHEMSARYVEASLRAAGYTPWRQTFPFVYDKVTSTSLKELSPSPRDVAHTPMSYSPPAPKGGIEAELVAPAGAKGCAAADWSGVAATGKIALVERGTCSFATKSKAAKAAGAVAVLIYNNTSGPSLGGTLGAMSDQLAPTTGISQDDGKALAAELAKGPVRMRFVLDKIIENRTTFNVIAETRTGSADDVLMVGAHLDSVQAGPGINDNGSGTATVLEVATQLPKVDPSRRVRFAWWGAEELGLIGSTHYVDSLDEASRSKISGYLNFDMVASPNYIIGVYDAQQEWMPKGSDRLMRALTNAYDAKKQPWVPAAMQGGSDQAPFIDAGIPVGGVITGAGGKKTQEEADIFGGEVGVPYDVNYHQPSDTLANASKRALAINVPAIAAAVQSLASGPATVGTNGAGVRTAAGPSRPMTAHDHGCEHADR